jgi:hypothetical protein
VASTTVEIIIAATRGFKNVVSALGTHLERIGRKKRHGQKGNKIIGLLSVKITLRIEKNKSAKHKTFRRQIDHQRG